MFDVLVIGGGLAGTTAALAARQAGAKVAVASRGWGATALCTGALDIAYTPALSPVQRTPRTLADHIRDIIAHRPRHPYGVLGLAQSEACLTAGYALLQEVLTDSGLDIPRLDMGHENHGLASSLGTILPAAGAFLPHQGVDLSRPGRWGLLKLAGDPYFDTARVRRGIARDATAFYDAGIELVELPVVFAAGRPMIVARQLDDLSTAANLARELSGKGKGLQGIIAPPTLGLERQAQVRGLLQDAAGVPVVEALAHMPSVPGVRLQQALERALRAAGVHSLGEVVTPRHDAGRVRAMVTGDNLEIAAGAFVLATGRFIAGGLRWNDLCEESLFGLPVVTEIGRLEEDSPINVVRELPVESHPLMTAGVKVNRRLQPIAEGRVPYDNLFAAGMLIGGFASRYSLCADGVALATGWLAGKSATGTGA